MKIARSRAPRRQRTPPAADRTQEGWGEAHRLTAACKIARTSPSPDTRPGSAEWRRVKGRPRGGHAVAVVCGAAEGGRGPRTPAPLTR